MSHLWQHVKKNRSDTLGFLEGDIKGLEIGQSRRGCGKAEFESASLWMYKESRSKVRQVDIKFKPRLFPCVTENPRHSR